MPEYIERNKVLSGEEFFGEHLTQDNPMTDGCMAVRSEFIMNLPAADVAPVVYGYWIDEGIHGDWAYETDGHGRSWHLWRCNICNNKAKNTHNYCPSCGAKMRGKSVI